MAVIGVITMKDSQIIQLAVDVHNHAADYVKKYASI